MPTPKNVKTLSRSKKIVLSIVILVAGYTVIGFLILPPILKSVLAKKLSENFHRQTTIQDIDLNPYALSLSIEGLKVREPEGSETFVSLDRLYVNMQVMSAFARAVVVRELRIEKPYVNLIRHGENRYNFSDLLTDKGEQDKKEKGGSTPIRFSLNNIQLLDGAIHVLDEPKEKEHKITDINIGLPLISNLPYNVGRFVQPLFAAKFNETTISLEGRAKPFAESHQTILDIDLKGINIPYYLAYVPVKLDFKMLKGFLDLKGTISYTAQPKAKPTLSLAGDLAIRTVDIVDAEDRPMLKVPMLGVSINSAAPLAGKIHLSKVVIESPEVTVQRDEAGNINLAKLVPDQKSETSAPESESEGTVLSIAVDDFQITGGQVAFFDFPENKPFKSTLHPVNATVRHFSNAKGELSAFDFSLETEAGESLTLGGEFSVNPLRAEGELELQSVSVAKYGPYIPDRVQLTVTDGKFSTGGHFSLSALEEGGITSTYKGQVVLSDLACVDKLHTEDLVKWRALRLDDMDIGFNPSYVNIGEISLNELFAHLIVNGDGKLNLQTIVAQKKEEEPAASEEEGTTVQSIKIGKVSLKGGRVNFLDKSIKPSYSAKLTDLEGSVTGLTSEGAKTADVLFRGKLDNQAPLEIKGKINPLGKDLFVDLKVAFKNIELSPMTPYSGKYVGRTIGKGKLSLTLDYLIDKKKLDSQNNFFIDQLTFGDKVESPEATNLPVALGVALLKNRKGEIDLDVPVSGSLDDPEFKVGKIVLKTIMNLLVKAATSPFALLGAVVGGGEELSVLEFDEGRSVISPETQKKLDTLIDALYERPSLKLDIEGHADVEKDRDGLREYLFHEKLQAQKLKHLMKKGSPAVPVDEVQIGPDEYEEYLEKAYKAESFDKQKNFLGFTKKLPVPEMERLIREHIVVSDDDLRLLAVERAKAVERYLLESKKIEPQRLFLIEPKSLAPERKEGIKDSRVDLRIK